ncbi:MAG TPA: hypothetical protein VHZ81_00040 [Galbitalea sp.]|jgi:hypothetical protein|nr:hypothetical protein [Galbitalea sp.]
MQVAGGDFIETSQIWGGRNEFNEAWQPLLSNLARLISELGGQFEGSPRIWIEFLMAGTIWEPEFEGVRTGSYYRTTDQLKIQVTLPQSPSSDRGAYFAERMRSVLQEAEAWGIRRKQPVDLRPLVGVIRRL